MIKPLTLLFIAMLSQYTVSYHLTTTIKTHNSPQKAKKQSLDTHLLLKWQSIALTQALAITMMGQPAIAVSGGGLDYANLDVSGDVKQFVEGNFKVRARR
jgi:hypothetical protein